VITALKIGKDVENSVPVSEFERKTAKNGAKKIHATWNLGEKYFSPMMSGIDESHGIMIDRTFGVIYVYSIV
jgi:hypothetical protein